MGQKKTQNLRFLCQESSPSIIFTLLFRIAIKFFPETVFCNQSTHSGSYNYSTSSVQLTAPEQSSSENGTHFYFDNGC